MAGNTPNPHQAKIMGQAMGSNQQPETIDRHLSEVEDACQRVASGEWNTEQFADYIDQLAEKLQEREDFIRQIEIPPEAIEDMREELEVGFSGIAHWNDGVARLSQFIDEVDVTHLEEGLDLCRQGNDLLNEAMTINRENFKRVETMYRESSTMS